MPVECVDGGHMDRLGRKQAVDEVDIAWCISGRWQVNCEMGNDVVYASVRKLC